jgi:hypothetical protein
MQEHQHFDPQLRYRRGVNVWGAISLVLACASLSCAWIPICGLAQWPLAGIALILGIIGAITSTDNRTGSGLPIAGILLSVLAIVLPLISTFWMAASQHPPSSQPSTSIGTDKP